MKIVKVLLAVIASLADTTSFSHQGQSIGVQSSSYPLPRVELKYMNELFTKELILSKKFKDNELVPIQIQLIKSEIKDDHEGDLYLTIEHVQVNFALQETVALTSDDFAGHLVLIPLYWAPGFELKTGSRIVFNIKYNYNRSNKIVEMGQVSHEIRL